MTQFQIIQLNEGVATICPQFGLFDNGKEAASMARNLSAQFGAKFQVRPVEKDVDWRAREKARFEDGTYQPLPWVDRVTLNPDHFAHISMKDSSKLAFILNEERGKADIQSSLPVNAYLNTYHPNLNQHQKSVIIRVHNGLDENQKVAFALTADQIEKVYRLGPESCMAGDSGEFSSPFHPVRAYAAGDLAVAYLPDYSARTVVWPAKKIYTRVYGDEADTLIALLEKEGYFYDYLGFTGARLTLTWAEYFDEEDEEEVNAPVAPYLDFIRRAIVEGDHLIVDPRHGKFSCDRTDGFSYPSEWITSFPCSVCSESECNVPIYVRPKGNSEGTSYCIDCAVTEGIACLITGLHGSNLVRLADGRAIGPNYVESHTFVCPETGERWMKRDGVIRNGELVSPNYKEQAA